MDAGTEQLNKFTIYMFYLFYFIFFLGQQLFCEAGQLWFQLLLSKQYLNIEIINTFQIIL